MTRGKKTLILLVCVVTAGIFIWKQKSYSVDNIPVSADAIAVFDTKRIAENLLWEFMTTPRLWKPGKLFTSSEETGWQKMFDIPDYLVAFHLKGQSAEKWYAVVPVKNNGKFRQGMAQRGFMEEEGYFLHSAGITGKIHNNYFVAGHGADTADIITLIRLLESKEWAEPAFLESAVHDKQQGVIALKNNPHTGNIHIGLSRQEYRLSTTLKRAEEWQSAIFNSDTGALVNIMFTQPPPSWYTLLPGSMKAKISNGIGVDPNSLLLPENKWYALTIAGFTTKTDTIVSYDFDDNFNPVEKKSLEEISEPSFSLEIGALHAAQLLDYSIRSGATTDNGNGQMQFTAFPLATSFIKHTDSMLTIASYQHKAPEHVLPVTAFLYAEIQTRRLQQTAGKYLPDDWQQFMKYFSRVELTGNDDGGDKKITLKLIRN